MTSPSSLRLLWRNSRPIGDRIAQPRLGKCPQSQPATIARTARFVIKLIARPCAVEWSAQVSTALDDLTLSHRDHRGLDNDMSFGACPLANQRLECSIIFRAAIRIARAIFRDHPYENCSRSNYFGPAHRRREKMSIAERYVRNRDSRVGCKRLSRLRYGYLPVGESRAADLRERVNPDDQPFAGTVKIRDFIKRPPLATLGPLAVARVQQRERI